MQRFFISCCLHEKIRNNYLVGNATHFVDMPTSFFDKIRQISFLCIPCCVANTFVVLTSFDSTAFLQNVPRILAIIVGFVNTLFIVMLAL